jgi:hypothetical protein
MDRDDEDEVIAWFTPHILGRLSTHCGAAADFRTLHPLVSQLLSRRSPSLAWVGHFVACWQVSKRHPPITKVSE